MRISALISFALHVALFLVTWLGIPASHPEIAPMQVIEVELESEVATLEPPKPAPAPEPEKASPPPPPAPPPPAPPPPPPPPAPEPPQPVAPPEPVEAPKPEPEPAPVPEPKPDVAEIPAPKVTPKPAPEPPKAEPSPRPALKPTPRPKPQIAAKPEPKAEPEPKPKDDFASVLKTVSKLEKQASKPETKPEKKAEKTLQEQVAEALSRSRESAPQPLTPALSSSDLDAIRRQIEPCWNLPAGARDAQNMTVEIRTQLNSDGRVRTASIVDSGRAASDRFYRSMAESALRAVLNPRCQPLRLPPEKYDEWRVMILNFDPRGMF